MLESVWLVLKGNITLCFSLLTALVSLVLGGGTALLNFLLSIVRKSVVMKQHAKLYSPGYGIPFKTCKLIYINEMLGTFSLNVLLKPK